MNWEYLPSALGCLLAPLTSLKMLCPLVSLEK